MRAFGFALALVTVQGIRVHRRDDCYSKYEGKVLLQVSPCSADEIKAMQEQIDLGKCVELNDGAWRTNATGCADEEVVCRVEVAQELERLFGKSLHVVSMDAGGHFRETSGNVELFSEERGVSAQDSFYTRWRGFSDLTSRVEQAVRNSGGVAKLETFGKTIEGRSLKAVRVRGSNYKSGGPKVLVTFNLHAREWITGMAGVYAVENIIQKAKSNSRWLQGKEVVLVPMANPDGFVYSTSRDRYWRKNRRPKSNSMRCEGVDLNRNFPKDWGGRASTSTSSCSEVFIGSRSASEPETQALMNLMKQSPMSVMIDVHAYSQVILPSWAYTSRAHPRKNELLSLGGKMASAMKRKTGANYPVGDNLLGDASGCLPDYAQDRGALSYTFELRPSSGSQGGFNPSTSQIKPGVEETLEGILVAIDNARGR